MRKFASLTLAVTLGLLLWSCTKPAGNQADKAPFTAPANEPERSSATLSEQKMCAERAKKSFDNSAFPEDKTSTYTNHYDSRTNVCYVEVTSRQFVPPNTPSFSRLVYDAFEGRPYAEFSMIERTPTDLQHLVMCRITPRGQNEITCKSREEFDALTLKDFGIVPD